MQMLRRFWDAAVQIDSSAEEFDEKRMPFCRFGELSGLWRQGGLEKVREQAIGIRMRFKSFADYWDPFLLGQGPAGLYVRRLSREKLPSLREELKRRLFLPAEDRAFDLPARVWSVCGIVPDRG